MPVPFFSPRSTGFPTGSISARNEFDIGRQHGATDVRQAASDEERMLLWKGRKTAFGAVAQIAPNYYLHDTVVPRSKLADTLEEVYRIADEHDLAVVNVFHAGDGNLHPLLLFNGQEPEFTIVFTPLEQRSLKLRSQPEGCSLGNTASASKSNLICQMFSEDDLDHQERLRHAFDPACRSGPGVILLVTHAQIFSRFAMSPKKCGDERLRQTCWSRRPRHRRGGRTRWHVGGKFTPMCEVHAPSGVMSYDLAAEMTVTVRAGTTTELTAALTEAGQRCALPNVAALSAAPSLSVRTTPKY